MTSAPTRSAPIAVWRIAEAFMHALCGLFGNPEDVAAEDTLSAKTHALLRDWIRAGEAILRKLLLIEAAALPSAPRGALTPSRRRTPRKRKLMYFTHDKPEKWRVSFRYLPSSPACGGSAERSEAKGDVTRAPSDAFGVSSPARGGDKIRFHSAWPLAERYEALVRVFNNPAPYAARLAKRLRAKPQNAAAMLRDPKRFAYTLNPIEREELATAAAPALRHFERG
jgi:hypothetical protein